LILISADAADTAVDKKDRKIVNRKKLPASKRMSRLLYHAKGFVWTVHAGLLASRVRM
jgi:hypothetical protein